MIIIIVDQGFLNYGSRPQMGSLGEILGSRDFNGLMDGVAVLQVFYQKFNKKGFFISSSAKLKIRILS